MRCSPRSLSLCTIINGYNVPPEVRIFTTEIHTNLFDNIRSIRGFDISLCLPTYALCFARKYKISIGFCGRGDVKLRAPDHGQLLFTRILYSSLSPCYISYSFWACQVQQWQVKETVLFFPHSVCGTFSFGPETSSHTWIVYKPKLVKCKH